MSNTPSPKGADNLDAWKQDRQKAKDEAAARRRREGEQAARNARQRSLFALALDHGNAIAGGKPPPSSGDAADFLIRLRAGLADDGLLRWLDRMEEIGPKPLRRFALEAIRRATPEGRGATAGRLETKLTDSELWRDFWFEVAGVGGVVWDWLQENVPAGGPIHQEAAPGVAAEADSTAGGAEKKARRPRMRVAEANTKAMAILKAERTKFTRLSENDQARRIGCSWDTWHKTALYGRLKREKPDKGTKPAKDGGPRNVVGLSAKMVEAAVADEPDTLDRLIKEQAAEQSSDPSPLDFDQPDAYPRRVKNRKRL